MNRPITLPTIIEDADGISANVSQAGKSARVLSTEANGVGRKGEFERWRDEWLQAVLSNRTVRPSSKAVATAIYFHLNREKRTAWPSIRTLDKKSGLSKATVQAALKELEGSGYLRIIRRPKKHSRERESNVYKPTVPGRRTVGTRGSNSDTPRTNSRHTVSYPSRTEPLNEPVSEPSNEPLMQLASQAASVAERPDARAAVFALGRRLFGKDAGGLVYRLLQYYGGDVEKTLSYLKEAEESGEGRVAIGRLIHYDV
jgi:hypothetical protein